MGIKLPKLPKGYAPSEKEEYMSPKQLAYFKKKLDDWKGELQEEIQATADELREEEWTEADILDRATHETDTSVKLRTRNRYLKLISKIDQALHKIDSGDYGYCEETGEEIGIKRLEARPIATLCLEAQERHEREEKLFEDE